MSDNINTATSKVQHFSWYVEHWRAQGGFFIPRLFTVGVFTFMGGVTYECWGFYKGGSGAALGVFLPKK